MDADVTHPERVIFENNNGQPVNPFTGKPPAKPRGFSGGRQAWRSASRSQTHIELNP